MLSTRYPQALNIASTINTDKHRTMKTLNVTLSGRHATLKFTPEKYVDEVDRLARASNISTFLDENWETLASVGDSIATKRLRDFLIDGVGSSIKGTKGEYLSALPKRGLMGEPAEVRAGDDRATGDAAGAHCLQLTDVTHIIAGKRTKAIVLSFENREKVKTFLARTSKERVKCIV